MGRTLRRTWSLAGALVAAGLSAAALTTPATAGVTGSEGRMPPRIVGGEPASINEYPWVVYLTDTGGNLFCGGAVGAPDKIVVAAHCVQSRMPGAIRVVAGRESRTTTEGTEAMVTDLWVHPRFQGSSTGNDIAVLTLDQQLLQPALPLASGQDGALYQPGTPTTVLGWGATSEGGAASDVLRKAHPPLISDEDCSRDYGNSFDARSMVCAGLPEGGVDSCQGDSGGPLVAGDKLVGLVSWGNGCARPGNPGVYTRVATYHDEVRAQLNS